MAGLMLAGGGAIAGGFAGLMSTVDMPEQEMHWYRQQLEKGNALVLVQTNGRYSEAMAILQIHGAYAIDREKTIATNAEK
jgi:hypothetical protein